MARYSLFVLKVPLHTTTRRLTAMYKSVNSLNSVSPDQLHQHSRLTRQVDENGLSFVQLQCRTDAYKYS